MKVPYIKIEQKNETFYVTKIKASVLRDHVNFHFRDPYSSENDRKVMYSEYINKIKEDENSAVKWFDVDENKYRVNIKPVIEYKGNLFEFELPFISVVNNS